MIDASTAVVARLTGRDELHHYTLEVEAGQRYRVELQAMAEWSWDDVFLTLDDGPVRPFSEGWIGVGGRATGSFIFAADQDRTVGLTLRIGNRNQDAADYRLQVRTIGADDHGDTRASATPLLSGQIGAGDLDRRGDVDVFAVDLQAGQRYVFSASGVGTEALSRPILVVGPPGGDGSTYLFGGGAFLATESGRHTVELGGGLGRYQIRFDSRPADDHGDLLTDATPLAVGLSASGRIEVPHDNDTFRVELLQGQLFEAELVVPSGDGNAVLLLLDGNGYAVAGGSATSEAGRSGLRHVAAADGPVFLQVTGSGWAGDYRIHTGLRLRDDHGDRSVEATPLLPGTEATGLFDDAWDRDMFSIDVRAGHSYRVELDGPDPSVPFPGNFPTLSSARLDSFAFTASSFEGGRLRLLMQALADDRVTLDLQSAQLTDYRVKLVELPADDHADGPVGATRLTPGQPLEAWLDPGFEADAFVFEAVAGQQYRILVAALDAAAWSDGQLSLGNAWWLGSSGSPAEGPSRLSMFIGTPENGGPVSLTFAAVASEALRYAVRVDPVDAAGGMAGVVEIDRGRLLAGAFQVLGPTLEGTAGADRLEGTGLDDLIRGGAGHDSLHGGPGNDRLHGGAGVDVARYDGRLEGYELAFRWDGTLQVSALAGPDGSDGLEGIERLQFADAAAALDFAAGDVGARVMRLLHAAVGNEVLMYTELFGALLAEADRGAGDIELARMLLAQGPSRPGAEAWVHQVAEHVPGLQLSAEDTDYWVQRLTRDESAAAEALALAASTPAAQAAIDLLGIPVVVWYTPGGP